jgi:hypothetical protein
VTRTFPAVLATALLVAGAPALLAQAASVSPSPTLPSDTLEANYAPRTNVPGPMPETAPSLPSDTLDLSEPVDTFSIAPFGNDSVAPQSVPDDSLEPAPQAPGDSAELRELRTWIRRHPSFLAPPPARAVLVKV